MLKPLPPGGSPCVLLGMWPERPPFLQVKSFHHNWFEPLLHKSSHLPRVQGLCDRTSGLLRAARVDVRWLQSLHRLRPEPQWKREERRPTGNESFYWIMMVPVNNFNMQLIICPTIPMFRCVSTVTREFTIHALPLSLKNVQRYWRGLMIWIGFMMPY